MPIDESLLDTQLLDAPFDAPASGIAGERIAATVMLCRTSRRVSYLARTISEDVEVTRSDDESVLR